MRFKKHFNSTVQTSHCYSLLEETVIACVTLDAGFLPRKLEIKLPAFRSFVRSTPSTTKKTLTSSMSTVDIHVDDDCYNGLAVLSKHRM